ncbi:MFS transporter [Cohnella sp.]|uniref:MFS transporter n=1 Tax=Cohnella sp. TaxID=1883426 RepID=UPI003569A85F
MKTAPTERGEPEAARRLSGLPALHFLVAAPLAFVSVYLPLTLQAKGLGMAEIGATLAAGSLVGLFGQLLWGALSDRFGTSRRVLAPLLIGAGLLLGGLYASAAVWAAAACAVAVRLCTTSLQPLTDSWTLLEAGTAGFGRYRLWGSAGFVLLTAGMGLAASDSGLVAVHVFQWAALAAGAALAIGMKERRRPRAGAADWRRAGRVLRHPSIWKLLPFAALAAVPARAFESFLSLNAKQLGADELTVAGLSVLEPVCEIPFLLLGMAGIRRYGADRALLLAAMLYVCAWLALLSFSSLYALAAAQAPLAGGAMLLYLAVTVYLREILPEGMLAMGQSALFVVLYSFSGMVGNLLGGFLLEEGGPTALFGAALLLSACAAAGFAGRLRSAKVSGKHRNGTYFD